MSDMADALDDQLFNEASGLESHRNRGPTWTTKTGEKILLRNMQTSHIQNCIRMFQRVVDTYPGEQVYIGDSEYAEEAVESENRINAERLEACKHNIGIFERELKKRKPDTRKPQTPTNEEGN